SIRLASGSRTDTTCTPTPGKRSGTPTRRRARCRRCARRPRASSASGDRAQGWGWARWARKDTRREPTPTPERGCLPRACGGRPLLRRGAERRMAPLRLDDLSLDPATRTVSRGGRRVELTTREYALLEYLVRNAGRVLTRPMIAEHVWGLDFDSESNVIDVYVGYLRRKIDASGERRLLHTVRGAGYVLKGAE